MIRRREPTRGPRPRGGQLRRAPATRRESQTVFVVAEGEGTEYDYFEHINRVFKLHQGPWLAFPPNSEQRGMTPEQVVRQAQKRLGAEDIDEVWALFDHDARLDRQIDPVCADARRAGVQVALSHPAFELWLLLHFESFSPVPQYGLNQQIIRKLQRAHPSFADYGKVDKRIDVHRFDALMDGDGLRLALKRARRLDTACQYASCQNAEGGHSSDCLPSKRDSSTSVWHLIERLRTMAES